MNNGFQWLTHSDIPTASELPGWMIEHADYTGQDALDFAAREESRAANSLGGKVGDLLGFTTHAADADYWKTMSNRSYESAAVQDARAWDEYMQGTQYQRMVQDLEAAGLNPWLAVSHPLSSGASSATTGGRESYSSSDTKAASAGGWLVVLGLVRLFASLFTKNERGFGKSLMQLNSYR